MPSAQDGRLVRSSFALFHIWEEVAIYFQSLAHKCRKLAYLNHFTSTDKTGTTMAPDWWIMYQRHGCLPFRGRPFDWASRTTKPGGGDKSLNPCSKFIKTNMAPWICNVWWELTFITCSITSQSTGGNKPWIYISYSLRPASGGAGSFLSRLMRLNTDIHSPFRGKAHFGAVRRETTEPFSGQSLFPLITANSPSIIIIFHIFLLLPPPTAFQWTRTLFWMIMFVRVGHFLCLYLSGVMFPAPPPPRMQIQTCSGFLGLVNSSTWITVMFGGGHSALLYESPGHQVACVPPPWQDGGSQRSFPTHTYAWKAAMSWRPENLKVDHGWTDVWNNQFNHIAIVFAGACLC